MGTIGALDLVRSVPVASSGMRRIGSALSRERSQVDSDFSATLLAMAGHDLRQPLQVASAARRNLPTRSSSSHRTKLHSSPAISSTSTAVTPLTDPVRSRL
jgi:hypothetical protein